MHKAPYLLNVTLLYKIAQTVILEALRNKTLHSYMSSLLFIVVRDEPMRAPDFFYHGMPLRNGVPTVRVGWKKVARVTVGWKWKLCNLIWYAGMSVLFLVFFVQKTFQNYKSVCFTCAEIPFSSLTRLSDHCSLYYAVRSDTRWWFARGMLKIFADFSWQKLMCCTQQFVYSCGVLKEVVNVLD